MSRADAEPVAMRELLRAIADIYAATSDDEAPRIQISAGRRGPADRARSMEGRLGQVLRNLVSQRHLLLAALRHDLDHRAAAPGPHPDHRAGRRPGHSAGQAEGDFRALLFRAAAGREVSAPIPASASPSPSRSSRRMAAALSAENLMTPDGARRRRPVHHRPARPLTCARWPTAPRSPANGRAVLILGPSGSRQVRSGAAPDRPGRPNSSPTTWSN